MVKVSQHNIECTLPLFYFNFYRTLINGDKEAGFSIFWADEGLDTGPILLKRACNVEKNDTVDSLYNRFLYPEGIKAMVILTNMTYLLKYFNALRKM